MTQGPSRKYPGPNRGKPIVANHNIAVRTATDPGTRRRHILSATLRGLPLLALVPKHARTMVLACYGPSLRETFSHIPFNGEVFTVSGAHDFLIERGRVPMGHIECDTRAHKATMFTPDARVEYFIASCAHGDVFDKLEGYRVVLWHRAGSREEDEEIRLISPDSPLVEGGATVGLDAIAVGSVMGYRSFDIYGMDCSFEDGEKDAGAQHAGAHPNPGDIRMHVKLQNGLGFWTSPQMLGQMREFLQIVADTTYAFSLHGRGLLAEVCRFQNVARVVLDGERTLH